MERDDLRRERTALRTGRSDHGSRKDGRRASVSRARLQIERVREIGRARMLSGHRPVIGLHGLLGLGKAARQTLARRFWAEGGLS